MQLRRHQELALAALEGAWEDGRTRCQVMLPPGAGKTLLGLEAVRRLVAAGDVGRGVVLGPNTAIQDQWVRAAQSLGLEAGAERDLGAEVNALTYQALAVFEADDEVDEDGRELLDAGDAGSRAVRGRSIADLHPHAQALVDQLRQAGPILLVLDECHHLLEVWGRLLAELLEELPQARVLALTATPPDVLTKDQQALTDELFGPPVYQTSIPAVVREGDLVPFAELVWLTTPTTSERDWLAEGAVRFRELTTQLCDPDFGDPGFLVWLDARYAAGEQPGDSPARAPRPSWATLLRAEPEQCRAVLRLHHAGLLALPAGATLGEEHRVPVAVEDWMLLIDLWLGETVPESTSRSPSAPLSSAGHAVREAVRRALPSVGYTLTRSGVRRGRTPVDRVLARSEAKAPVAVQIIEQELAHLGDGARALVLCDHEVASATLPADLDGVIASQAGSARAVLQELLDSEAGADAVLVTGRTVAGAESTLRRLSEHVATTDPQTARRLSVVPAGVSGDVPRLDGPWSSRTWVRHVTDFFESGQCHVLVGTRGLLGEGWDARRVTTLVDLTAITTTTAVVQTRGRALRTDPASPDKVALTWSVVCVAPEHPRGDNDWQRLVRKHTGFFGADDEGAVVDGVGHLDAAFSPYAPPAVDTFEEINARMLVRAGERDAVRERWRVGSAYDDEAGVSVRIRARRARTGDDHLPSGAGPAGVVQREARIEDRREGAARPAWPMLLLAAVVAWLIGLAIPGLVGWNVALPLLLLTAVVGGVPLVRSLAGLGRERHEQAQAPPSVEQVGGAVADAMRACGICEVGAEGLQIAHEGDDGWRVELDGVDESVSGTFAIALDQALAPLSSPRYIVARFVAPTGPLGWWEAVRVGRGRPHPSAATVWHPVPDVLGTNAERAGEYAAAFDRWIGGGPAVYTAGPEGAGALAAQAGADPFEVTTTMRRTWD